MALSALALTPGSMAVWVPHVWLELSSRPTSPAPKSNGINTTTPAASAIATGAWTAP